MTEIVLIDRQLERAEKFATALVQQGLRTRIVSTLGTPENLGSCACIVANYDDINDRLAETAKLFPIIVLTDDPTVANAVSCLHRGAADYLSLPIETAELVAAIERASANNTRQPPQSLDQFQMIGSSQVMQTLKQGIAKAAPTDSTVLITGQSGTGKELVARAIHSASKRSAAPMFSINCATVPDNLIEAEIFGMEQFDDQQQGRGGLIEAAEGGSLFLDEIAELPASAQARLLQVLQGENRRVGSSSTNAVNVRLIVATHRNLEQLTLSGQFRQDLYYRLNVVKFDLPPLHQRQQDILEIADGLLEKTSSRLSKTGLSFSAEARSAMLNYNWPGNVRELENAIERAVILSDSDAPISQALLAIDTIPNPQTPAEVANPTSETSLEDYFVRFVLDHQDQLTETELAQKLGISRKSLWERRQRLNIPRRKTRKRGPRREASES